MHPYVHNQKRGFMTFRLRLQDPASDANNFLEILLESTAHADRGAATFSFSSVHGVRLLLSDRAFKKFLRRSRFELIVGVDAVTVPDVLELLQRTQQEYTGFRVRAFLNRRKSALFHPKLCWFAAARTGRVLVGSSNLTRGGLLNNWEAFGDAVLRGNRLTTFEATWNDWLTLNEENLREPDDSEVVARASQNEGQRWRRHEEDMVEVADIESPTIATEDDVLVAEIPRGGLRWRQANFDKDNFVHFFGLQPGVSRRVVLFPVQQNGEMGDQEVRPGVDVASHNYRIELGQAADLNYPDDGRPIGVFLKLGTRRFRYRLVMPGQPQYEPISTFLNQRTMPHRKRIRRFRTVFRELQEHVPDVLSH